MWFIPASIMFDHFISLRANRQEISLLHSAPRLSRRNCSQFQIIRFFLVGGKNWRCFHVIKRSHFPPLDGGSARQASRACSVAATASLGVFSDCIRRHLTKDNLLPAYYFHHISATSKIRSVVYSLPGKCTVPIAVFPPVTSAVD